MKAGLRRLKIDSDSVYFRILASTLVVTVLPILIIYIFSFGQSMRTIEQQARAIDLQFLEQTQENVEQTLQRIQQSAAALANSPDSISFVFSRKISEWEIIQRLGGELSALAAYNSLISSVYIYSANNGNILTSDYRYYPVAAFYDQSWLSIYEQGGASPYWTEPRTITDAEGTPHTGVSLIVHVPSSSRKLSGAIILNLNSSSVDTELLACDAENPNASGIVVLDGGLQPLFGNVSNPGLLRETQKNGLEGSGSSMVKTGNGKYLVSRTYSPRYGWYYARVTEIDQVVSSYKYLPVMLLFFVVILILSCVLALWLSKRLYRPVRILVEEMTGEHLEDNVLSNEYSTIRREYSKIQTKASALELEITELQPLVQERLFRRLLLGQLETPDAELSQFGFSNCQYAVLIVNYPISQEQSARSSLQYFRIRTRLEGIFQKASGLFAVCVELGSDTIAVLINYQTEVSSMEVRKVLLDLSKLTRNTLAEELHTESVTGFSPLCQTAADIPGAYMTALKSVQFKRYQNSNDVVTEDDELFVPYSSLLQELLSQITSGNRAYTQAALEELTAEIQKQVTTLSQFEIQQIATWMLNSIMELLIRSKLKIAQVFGEKRHLFSELQRLDDLPSIHKWLESVCLQAAAEVSRINVHQTHQKVSQLLEYIDLHIAEDISLNDVAAWIGLSPAYVSRIFKENVGQNFVEYLNNRRVDRAKQLLQNTQLSIKEVGFKAGFNNNQSFIRTFKKAENCTPSQFRKSQEPGRAEDAR